MLVFPSQMKNIFLLYFHFSFVKFRVEWPKPYIKTIHGKTTKDLSGLATLLIQETMFPLLNPHRNIGRLLLPP